MGIPVSSCLPCVLPVLRLMLLLAIPLHLPRKSPPQPTQCASAEAPKSISISISISLPSLSRELAFLKFLISVRFAGPAVSGLPACFFRAIAPGYLFRLAPHFAHPILEEDEERREGVAEASTLNA